MLKVIWGMWLGALLIIIIPLCGAPHFTHQRVFAYCRHVMICGGRSVMCGCGADGFASGLAQSAAVWSATGRYFQH